MKILLLLLAGIAAWGQASPVKRNKTYAGAPTAGDCTAATVGVLTAVNTVPDPDSIYDCVDVAAAATWVVRGPGTGTVTSVGWTGGIVSVATATTTPAFTIAGTSGGVPYFSNGTTWASSTAPVAGQLMVWGGAGNAPTGVAANTYQPLDSDLTDIAALAPSRGGMIRRGAAAWENVALGATGALMSSDGTDAVWLARVSASSVIDFASINDGACLENTFTLTGSVLGDAPSLGMSAALNTGLQATVEVSATDTAKVKICNFSGAAVNPASMTFTARVVR